MEEILDTYIPDMSKSWTPEEIRELAALAKVKGIKKGELAEEYIGVRAGTLSVWMRNERTEEIPLVSKNALSWIELRISRMADKKKRG